MPMYNLTEYGKNYRTTTGSLWNYYRDEPDNPPFVLDANSCSTNVLNYNSDPITNSESFKYKSSITGKTPNSDNGNNNVIENAEIVVPL